MKPPMIKPSHRGLLHKELGIPEGEKIGEKRLEAAKHSSNPAERKRANFALNFNDIGHHGYVTHIGSHYERPNDYAEITVAHGKRSKLKGPDGKVVAGDYDNRPTSRVIVPKSHAHKFRIGMRVGVGAVPLEGPDTDEMPGQDEAMGDYHRVVRGIIGGRKPKR